MSRDWNIIDDEVVEPSQSDATSPPTPFTEYELDSNRIHRIVRERRAADRLWLWRVGIAALIVMSAAAIVIRLVGWMKR